MATNKRKPHGDHDGWEDWIGSLEVADSPEAKLVAEIRLKRLKEVIFEEEKTPLAKAYLILLRAYDRPERKRRVRLAKRALDICPACSDAYFLLAYESRGRREALRLYEQAVAAGARELGPEAFERDVGRFWRIVEARPYMRARLQQANCLWKLGRREQAVEHLRDLIRLNPEDNQRVRYQLASFLLYLDRDNELVELLRQYREERSATWAYTKALICFRKSGDTIEARRLLKHALKINKHVPRYLVDEKVAPDDISGQYRTGSDCEAVNYIDFFLGAWWSTAGAVAWLRDNIYKKKKAQQPTGPLGIVKRQLINSVPRKYNMWQAHFGRVANWAGTGAKRQRPWVIVVTSPSAGWILAHDMQEEPPSAASLWDTVVQAMQNPAMGKAHRPSELHVRYDERWESLKGHLDEIGIELVTEGDLDFVDKTFKEVTEDVWGKARPGLLDMPGVTPEQVGSCYTAAAAYFRRAPWKEMGYHAAIKIECGKFHSGPWYAMPSGQTSLIGLTLYEDLHALERMWSGRWDPLEGTRQMVSTGVVFLEESRSFSADVDACKKYGWEVARPDAYPVVIRKERGLSMRPALAWELELMEGCLRAVPDFMERHKGEEPAQAEMTVPVASGQLRMVLAWIDDE